MSINFIADRRILARELFDGRLKKYGISQGRSTHGVGYLTDGIGLLWVYLHDQKFVDVFTIYFSGGDPSKILVAIQNAFKTKIYSEHEPQYWGYENEWHRSNQPRKSNSKNGV